MKDGTYTSGLRQNLYSIKRQNFRYLDKRKVAAIYNNESGKRRYFFYNRLKQLFNRYT